MKKDIFIQMIEGLDGLCKRLEAFNTLAEFGKLQEGEMANSKTYTAAASYTYNIIEYAKSLVNALSQGKSALNQLITNEGGDGGWQRAIQKRIQNAENEITKSLKIAIGIDDTTEKQNALKAVQSAISAIRTIDTVWDNIRRIRNKKGMQAFDPIKLTSGIALNSANAEMFTLEYWLKNLLPQADLKDYDDQMTMMDNSIKSANYNNQINQFFAQNY